MAGVEETPQRRAGDSNPRPPAELHPNNMKRPLDSTAAAITATNASQALTSSSYFKMRSLLKDLRPHFIEVLRTPDFQNCKAAQDIREKLKLLMDLYRLMVVDKPGSTAKLNKSSRQVSGQPPSDNAGAKISETNPIEMQQQQQPERDTRGTYIVGGSASRSNFITFQGSKPLYCGITKESFRAAQAKLQGR